MTFFQLWNIRRYFKECFIYTNCTVKKNGYLLASMVPWRTFNIKLTFSFQKGPLDIDTFFTLRKTWFFYRNNCLKWKCLVSQEVNWWTEAMKITRGLLWCFYQLLGLTFWRHPFTAEDPLVSKWCNAKFLQTCSHEEQTHLHLWWPEGEYIFSQFSFLGELSL